MAPNRRTNKTILTGAMLLIIAAACIVTAGCTAGTSTPGATVGIIGTTWSLDSYLAENNTPVPILPGSEVSARFGPDGKVTGSAGCNQYGGNYHLENADLTISPPVSTKMYCNDPAGLMEQEARFLELIGSAAGCRIENDRMEIINASGATVLTFVKEAPAELAGTSWTLSNLVDEDGASVPVITGTTVTMIFDTDGTLGGTAGCNHYGADYTRNGADITIGTAFRTEMYCMEPGVMEQEDRYLAHLANVSLYRVEGSRLILSDESGADLLIFDRVVEVPDLPLAGTDWVLDSYTTRGDSVSPVIAGTTVTAKFSPDGNVTGNAGCNHYGGGYLLEGTNISVSSLFSTLMYCGEPEGVMEQEARYLALLGNASSYRVRGDRLTLTDEEGTDLLFFVQADEVPTVPLTGTAWTLESYRFSEDAVSSVIAGTAITAEFEPGGTVSGGAGCNRYFAAYEVSGEAMTIGPAGSTKMYCGEPEGVMEQEARYLGLLESVAGYQIDGDRLDLLDEAGKALLSFRAESGDQS